MFHRLTHIKNVRDLGGIPTMDGKTVVPHKLIRGGHLHDIRPKEKDLLKSELGISLIVDLRSPSELEEKPDVVPEGVEYIYLPSLTNEQNPSINRKNRRGELKRIMAQEGGSVGHLSRLYRLMITQDLARKSHRNLLLELLKPRNGAIYWHCTQGKDRTGTSAAVILMALGVSEEEILDDYLNETKALKFRNALLCKLAGAAMFSHKAGVNLHALMNATRPCMLAALDEMHKVYGTAENYLQEGLGMTEEQIRQLRSMYLI